MSGPRPLHAGAIVLFVVLAGCLSAGGALSAETTTTVTPITTPTTILTTTTPTTTTNVPPPKEYPEPPTALTNDSAIHVAEEYEEAYVFNRLREYEQNRVSEMEEITSYRYGGVSGTGATVRNRSQGGIYVAIEVMYYVNYKKSGTSVEGDYITEAVYFVSNDTVRRVRGSGVETL